MKSNNCMHPTPLYEILKGYFTFAPIQASVYCDLLETHRLQAGDVPNFVSLRETEVSRRAMRLLQWQNGYQVCADVDSPAIKLSGDTEAMLLIHQRGEQAWSPDEAGGVGHGLECLDCCGASDRWEREQVADCRQ
jgi:hypothetical protein